MRRIFLLLAGIGLLFAAPAFALNNGLALTPPMGWNSWNKFGCHVDQDLIKQIADAMVSSGMKAAGYQYIIIDDCWQVARDAQGNIVPDPKRFPDGMKALADYIHSKGLKFGIYSDAGTNTCQGRPGSRGYEYQDARTYASWGVDYLKYDWCHTGTQNIQASYETMRDALAASGRPIVFSLCEWGLDDPWKWAGSVGNLWRTTGDINPTWQRIMQILDLNAPLWRYAGPGHWNDPDMLEVGNPGLSTRESKSHFSLWCMLAAPLIAGNDLRHMSPAIRAVLTNKEVIALDQDPLGRQARRIIQQDDTEVWRKPLSGGNVAYLLLNRAETAKEMSLYIGSATRVRDLWKHQDEGPFTNGVFQANVPPHGVVVIRTLSQ